MIKIDKSIAVIAVLITAWVITAMFLSNNYFRISKQRIGFYMEVENEDNYNTFIIFIIY